MRSMRPMVALLGLAVTAFTSNALFTPLPTAQASPAQDQDGVVTEFGSREAIRESGLTGKALQDAVAAYVERTRSGAAVSASGAVDLQTVTDAPNTTEVLVQGTATWAGLTDYVSDPSGRMVVAYLDSRDGSHANGGFSLYIRRSNDAGMTWQPEQRIDNATGLGTALFGMNLTTDGRGNFYLIWDDARNSATTQLFASRSRDGGVTWSTPGLVAPASVVMTNTDIIADPIGHVFLTWQDDRLAGDSRIYSLYSPNFGDTWTTEVLIDDAGVGFDETIPQATYTRQGEILVGWETNRNAPGQDFMSARSIDGGATWSADFRVSPDPAGSTTVHGADFCSDMNGRVYSFVGLGDGTVWTRSSADFGATFAAPIEVTGADYSKLAAPTTATGCAFGSTYAAIAFEGGTTAGAGDNDVIVVVSKDGGATWSAPQRINLGTLSETYDQNEMYLNIDSRGRVLVAWTDERFSGVGGDLNDGFFNYSLDGGTTWQSTDFRFTGGTPSATRDVDLVTPTINVTDPAKEGVQTQDRGVFDLVWHDNMAGVTGGVAGLYYGAATFSGSKTSMTRLAGSNRYTTSVEISKSAFPTASTVSALVVATGENFPDGLSAAVLGSQISGPVLLTKKSSLPTEVAAEITRIYDKRTDAATDVYVVGGTAAIDESVATALDALDPSITVKRLAGANRKSTSVEVAKEIDSLRGATAKKVLLTTGANFPDALTAGAVGGNTGIESSLMPVLLTDTGTLDSTVAAYLASIGVTLTDVHILGGTAAVSTAVQTAVDAIGGSTVARHSGADRYETAAQVDRDFYTGVMTPQAFGLASGTNFADALPGGLHAARNRMPLLLTNPSSLSLPTMDYLVDMSGTIDTGTVYGGVAAIAQNVVDLATTLY